MNHGLHGNNGWEMDSGVALLTRPVLVAWYLARTLKRTWAWHPVLSGSYPCNPWLILLLSFCNALWDLGG